MKTQIALLVGLACGVAVVSSQPVEDKPVWQTDWPAAQRLARQANQPIFAVLVCKH